MLILGIKGCTVLLALIERMSSINVQIQAVSEGRLVA